ncbi:uncharacterized protein L3040_008569 [Drepanopeziza brunnea f. sp. 'multigermtubi']|uniref:Homeobox domain-containing protein n=1 Tax=Marssonina brunnea f. sp. multigermtubi (strain MB_m1) TaxID=1072389 RepID=K1WML4_MARBU|nr:homeobox domain-containing protein [Drepanopeziza brunnea f. sp. 'multigermtubi' MB_m1]EKD13567.1 homeobox domain-containing protein [Drepanopeziza brunnea f. sp. 'multigermtubi' MB_m1]KAJ5033454.1 hypothetical protein L3040_008569 [Drepanopeziza brunnea f. sp. 'multigermtubi']
MLVTRSFDSGRNTWTSSKLEALYQNVASPRMANFDQLPPQPDWREQYSGFPNPGANGHLQPAFQQASAPNTAGHEPHQQSAGERPTLERKHSNGPREHDAQPLPTTERPDSAPRECGHPDNLPSDDSIVSPESTSLSLGSIGSNSLSSASSAPSQQPPRVTNRSPDVEGDIKDEDDDLDDDDEMLDGEADDGTSAQTAAERRAERRKMKRFRLTHQQTRFLMSEFAKQAHPDAAHRERLSREIPGLSPRQVQVWFQNRRAKIKRLTADDRDRMMKMRAVPDDFDNVQALHSPYGAVHGVGTPMQSPIEYSPGYGEHMIRPMMVDTMRRSEADEHMSPTGLSPAFSHVGFSGGMGTPEGLSPVSMNSSERYYSSQMPSPMSSGPRSSNPFDRQGSYQQLSHPRQHARPLQPLQLRETLTRSRSDMNSPLRSSMSWKGETLDYDSYQTGQPSPAVNGRQQSAYQPEQMGNSGVHAHQYDANSYSNANANTSPTAGANANANANANVNHSPSTHSHMTYPPSHGAGGSSSMPPPPMRASSSGAFPASLDLRNQFRPAPPNPNSPHGVTPRTSTFAHSYQASGYASALMPPSQDYSNNSYNSNSLSPGHARGDSPHSQDEQQRQPSQPPPPPGGREASSYLNPVN